jgi:hypothetical protein
MRNALRVGRAPVARSALAITIAAIVIGSPASAQHAFSPGPALENGLTRALCEVIAAAKEYRTTLEALEPLLERDATKADEEAARRRDLCARGLATRREVEAAETRLAAAENEVRRNAARLAETDAVIAEAEAEEAIASLSPARRKGDAVARTIIRSQGARDWSVVEIASLNAFFSRTFGRAAPVSAFGQSAVHDRLGFDHRNAVDIAVHPSSPEGRALIAYLRGAGIPFTAFRSAVPGASTGAHIHVGRPSSRLR